jgi:hypothetical protein
MSDKFDHIIGITHWFRHHNILSKIYFIYILFNNLNNLPAVQKQVTPALALSQDRQSLFVELIHVRQFAWHK